MFDTIEYFHHACQNVVDDQDNPALNYAVNYAKHGLTITKVGREAHVQALYLRNNLSEWIGSIATETRSCLDNFIRVTKQKR